jgi:hypothetical protein
MVQSETAVRGIWRSFHGAKKGPKKTRKKKTK